MLACHDSSLTYVIARVIFVNGNCYCVVQVTIASHYLQTFLTRIICTRLQYIYCHALCTLKMRSKYQKHVQDAYTQTYQWNILQSCLSLYFQGNKSRTCMVSVQHATRPLYNSRSSPLRHTICCQCHRQLRNPPPFAIIVDTVGA